MTDSDSDPYENEDYCHAFIAEFEGRQPQAVAALRNAFHALVFKLTERSRVLQKTRPAFLESSVSFVAFIQALRTTREQGGKEIVGYLMREGKSVRISLATTEAGEDIAQTVRNLSTVGRGLLLSLVRMEV